MAKGINVKDKVIEITEEFLKDSDKELYKVEFKKEAKDWYLRVFIEKRQDASEKYVGTSDCEEVSKYLSAKLDELDLIEQNYYLEVSSPGMDRELINDKDFDRFSGEIVEIKLYKALDNRKEITGELMGLINGNIVVKVDDKTMELPKAMIAKINLAIVF